MKNKSETDFLLQLNIFSVSYISVKFIFLHDKIL